jgi:serine/threonine-protein kinase
MGRVWAARRLHSPTPQYVAVKTALEELSGDEEFERVFIDEARIASSIVHPNVCTIYELGVERGIPYLVMEWINGGSLHDIIAASDGRKIDCFLTASIVASVGAGLHAAHELTDLDGTPMHVVHRDVSPQNILVSGQGHVKIADFGVARARGQLHRPTETGELKGKLSYMAPEQLTTKTFDRRADVFALGCVLFQATTGQRPFHGNDALETMYKLLETTCERPSQLVADYPPELEAIVLKALEKDVSCRYQTAEELERALTKFLIAHGRLITDRDITGLVTATLGPRIEQRLVELKLAVETVEHPRTTVREGLGRDADESSSSSSGAETSSRHGSASKRLVTPAKQSSPQPDSGSDSVRTPNGVWESTRPNTVLTTRRHHITARQWLAYALVAIGVTGAGLALLSLKSPESRRALATATSTATPAPLVQIHIRTVPADALITLDDAPPAPSPLVLSRARDTMKHRLRVSRQDYQDEERDLVFDASKDLEVELRPMAAPSALSTQVPRSTGTRLAKSVTPAAVTPPASAPTTKNNEPTGSRTRKPNRPLDHNNPFSDP